jgi:hypothetical protein
MANPAEGYESYMVPTLFGPCARILIQAVDPKSGERVLDVGCGTGLVACEVASRLGATGALAGVDLSANMLAVARATRLTVILLSTLLQAQLAFAKRMPPVKVDPVVYEGVRYVAPNDDGRRGYIEAWNVGTNKKAWELTLFTNRIDPNLEEDVQWVFIKALSIQDGRLIVTSERRKTYQVDVNTKEITQSDLRSASSPGAIREVPDAVKKALTNGSLAKRYDLSFRVNPSYLEGDFNGDGKMDVAVLVKERSTGKLGIAIVHGTTEKVTILGAGIGIGNGGDDFAWMDSWQVYSKTRAAHATGETAVPHLRADALLVEKSEAASALIYWNGKRYVWSQQGE